MARVSARLAEWFPLADNLPAFIGHHRRFAPASAWLKLLKRFRAKGIANPGNALCLTVLREWIGPDGAVTPTRGPEDAYDDDMRLVGYGGPGAPEAPPRPWERPAAVLPPPVELTPAQEARYAALSARGGPGALPAGRPTRSFRDLGRGGAGRAAR